MNTACLLAATARSFGQAPAVPESPCKRVRFPQRK